MKINLFTLILLIVAAVFVIPSLNGPSYAQAKKTETVKVTKTEKLLKDADAPYGPFQGEGTFIVSYAGKEKKEIDVIIIETDAAVVTFADVAAGRLIDLTPEVMRKLLKFNMNADYIKVGISDFGSIRVQTEQNIELMNAKAFKDILDQIAAGADDVAKILKPVFKQTAKPVKQ